MSVTRRSLLAGAAAAALTGCGTPERPQWTAAPSAPGVDPVASGAASASPSPSASASAAPNPLEVKLDQTLRRHLKPTSDNPDHPWYAGAVALVLKDGAVAARVAVGDALRYAAGPVELSPGKRVPMRLDSIFDLASLTKVYTALLLMQQVERGKVDLAAPVVDYLPGFDGAGKAAVTVKMLLAHTAALPVGAKVTGYTTDAQRRAAVLATPLISGAVPGRTFRYSSVGLMVAAQLVEKVTGQTLTAALKAGLTGPLGLRDTGFKPLGWLSAADEAKRLVATDARSSRGLLRGVVHDDVANRLGGVAGHAGIFATAADVAVLGQLLLDGGTHRGRRVLAEATVKQMLTNVNAGLPAIDPDRPGRPSDHGLGVTLNQPWFMGKLSATTTWGHTGFTGTSLLVDQRRRLVLVLLTNRAHPNWSWANPDPVRVAIANVVATLL